MAQASALASGLGLNATGNPADAATEAMARVSALVSGFGLNATGNPADTAAAAMALALGKSVEAQKTAHEALSTAKDWMNRLHGGLIAGPAAMNASSFRVPGLNLNGSSTFVSRSDSVVQHCLDEINAVAGVKKLTWFNAFSVINHFVDNCEPLTETCFEAVSDEECAAGAMAAHERLSTALAAITDAAEKIPKGAEVGASFLASEEFGVKMPPVRKTLLSIGALNISGLEHVDGCADLNQKIVAACDFVVEKRPLVVPVLVIVIVVIVLVVLLALLCWACSCCCYLIGLFVVVRCCCRCCCRVCCCRCFCDNFCGGCCGLYWLVRKGLEKVFPGLTTPIAPHGKLIAPHGKLLPSAGPSSLV